MKVLQLQKKMPKIYESIKERLETNFTINPDKGCYEWTGYCDKQGYGKITIDSKTCKVHRVSYTLYKGEIPEGMLIRHTCDNKICFNPEHLLVGTHQDNTDDMVSRGRRVTSPSCFKKGEAHSKAILTLEKVKEIRKQIAKGLKYGDIKLMAEKYGVSNTTIGDIVNNKTWKV